VVSPLHIELSFYMVSQLIDSFRASIEMTPPTLPTPPFPIFLGVELAPRVLDDFSNPQLGRTNSAR
jgi:hypothetical protein